MVKKRSLSYTKAIIICHGKSELQICKYIKQALRLSVEIFSDKNGEKSIQITGLNNILGNTIFKSINNFSKEFVKLDITGKGNKKIINDFKLFIIMDTDDCTEKQSQDFINKNMFKKHWAYEYIEPIFNITNLEDVIKDCNIKYEKKYKNKERDIKSQYIDIFPTYDNRFSNQKIELSAFLEKLKNSNKTNLDKLIDYCIKCKQ